MAERKRLDVLLVERGLAPTRSRAQALVLAGRVRCGTLRHDKPGQQLVVDAPLEIVPGPRFVGRGGEKLAGALEVLELEVAGRDALDIGASTGGFTDALLQAGASRVIALDVGRGQLDWGLRNDPRVLVQEGINARYLDPASLPFAPDLAVIDVSFISVTKVLHAVVAALKPPADVLALIKPQFEAGRRRVGRGGIVRDSAVHREVLVAVGRFARGSTWGLRGLTASPLRGAEGNREFFMWLDARDDGLDEQSWAREIERVLATEVTSGGDR